MGIFNELSKDFNSGFNPAGNLGQVLELMNKFSRIRTRTAAFNPIIYKSLHEKDEQPVIPKTVNVNELKEEIDRGTRPQAGYVNMQSSTMITNNVVETNNIEQEPHDTEDYMDM